MVGVARGPQRPDTLKPYSQKTRQSNHTRTTALSNSVKLSHAHRATQDSILALRTPWTVERVIGTKDCKGKSIPELMSVWTNKDWEPIPDALVPCDCRERRRGCSELAVASQHLFPAFPIPVGPNSSVNPVQVSTPPLRSPQLSAPQIGLSGVKVILYPSPVIGVEMGL